MHSKQSKPRILYIPELNGLIDKGKVERDTRTRITSKKISSIQSGSFSELFPKKVNEYVSECKPDHLILHTGAHHIRSKFDGKYLNSRQMEAYKREITVAASNVFNTAIKTISSHKTVKKIIIMPKL